MLNSDANIVNDKDSIYKDSINDIQADPKIQKFLYFGEYNHDSNRVLGTGMNDSQIDRESHSNVSDAAKNFSCSDQVVPIDETNSNTAPINIPSVKDTDKDIDKDKYNSNAYLPQEKEKEKEKDWFETIETVDINDARMININRPIDIGGIGSTHKNAIYDKRCFDIDGVKTVCPKFVVSPWLQSSWEPDRSTKSLCD